MRREIKYLITYSEYKRIKQILEKCMKKDFHANKEGIYIIRTMYFDNYLREIQTDKINDINAVHKYRIRIYDNDETNIFIERKTNINDYIQKIKERVQKKDVINIIEGKYSELLDENSKLKTELYLNIILKQLRPIMLIEYNRMAFVEDNLNVRVTIDREIKSTTNINCFFKNVEGITKEKYILEIKYNEYLPEYIQNILINLRKTREKSKFMNEINKHANFGGI